MSCSCWSIPLELFLEIKVFLSELDYWKLLCSSKNRFREAAYRTRRITLTQDNIVNLDEFLRLVSSKIENLSRQLHLKLDRDSEGCFSALLALPDCDLSLVRDQLGWRSSTFYLEFINIVNRKTVSIDCNGVTGLDQFPKQPQAFHNIEKFSLLHLQGSINVQNFSMIQELYFHNCDITDVAPLGGVKKLTLSACPGVVDVSSLGRIPDLRIFKCLGLTDISGLTDNQNLEVRRCEQLQFFPPRMNQRHFDTDSSPFMHHLAAISASSADIFPRLRTFTGIDIDRVFNTAAGSSLQSMLSGLFSVSFTSCWCINSLPAGMKAIPVVSITKCNRLRDISELGRNLSVSIWSCDEITDFSSLKNVRKVKLGYCPGFVNGAEVAYVRHLLIASCEHFRDVSPLRNIHHLELYTFVPTFQGIEDIPCLELSDWGPGLLYSNYLGLKCQKIVFNENHFPSFLSFFPLLHEYNVSQDVGKKVTMIRNPPQMTKTGKQQKPPRNLISGLIGRMFSS